MDVSPLRRHLPALLIFAATLLLRVGTAWQFIHSPYAAPITGDMRFYAEWARRIADGQLTDFHAFYGQPLYAYSLGALFAVVGFQPALVALLQAVIDAATAVLIYRIATLAFPGTPRRGELIGYLAAIGWMLFVPAAAYSALLIPASLTVFAWWFCVWWLLARGAEAQPLEWLGVSLFVGSVAMASATILFVLPLFAWKLFRRRSPFAAALVFAGIVTGTAPAWAHNAFIARDPVFLSAHSGVNFWIGNNPEANGYPRVPRELPSEQAALLKKSIEVAEANAGRPLPRSAVSAFWAGKARDYIRAQPASWSRLLLRKLRNFWNAFATMILAQSPHSATPALSLRACRSGGWLRSEYPGCCWRVVRGAAATSGGRCCCRCWRSCRCL